MNKITEPKSTLERSRLARQLYEDLKQVRDTKDIASWYEGRIFWYFNKFNLYNYLFGKVLSKEKFYEEIDIPASTALAKRSLYDFYVVKHSFTVDELRKANTRKLHRALPFIQDKNREEIKEIISLAEREKQGLHDFLVSCGAPDKWCVHPETENINIKTCKKCGKQLKK